MKSFPGVLKRRGCRVVSQARSTQRFRPQIRSDEDVLTGRIIELASAFGHYGYRLIAALLKCEGWRVNHKRVKRIWRKAGFRADASKLKQSGGDFFRPAALSSPFRAYCNLFVLNKLQYVQTSGRFSFHAYDL